MDARFENRAQQQQRRRRRNLEAPTRDLQDHGLHLDPVHMSQLMAENALLKEQLQDAKNKQHQNYCRQLAAEKEVSELKRQLDSAQFDLRIAQNKVSASELKLQMARQRPQQNNNSAPKVPTAEQGTQTGDRTTSELIQELQMAHEELDMWTTKLQSREEQEEEEGEQERRERVQVQALKSGIFNLSVKLQQEQATLLKKATRTVSCTTGEKTTSHESCTAQSKEVEEVNLKLQTLQQDLLKQALSLRTAARPRTSENKYTWVKTHSDVQQQTDPLDEPAVEEQLYNVRKEAEEQLQLQQQHWQEERRTLQVTIQVLLNKQKEKTEEWTERQAYMAAKMEELESDMAEMLKKQKKKERSLLSRLFRRSSSN